MGDKSLEIITLLIGVPALSLLFWFMYKRRDKLGKVFRVYLIYLLVLATLYVFKIVFDLFN